MNPYHQWYQYDDFLFLVNHSTLPISGFGYTNTYETVSAVRKSGAEGYKILEAKEGHNLYDSFQKKQYDSFVRTYFMNRNKMLNESFMPSYLRAPNHLYSYSKSGGYKNKALVQNFQVIFNQVYTQNGKVVVLEKKVVDDIVIPTLSTLGK